MIMNRRIFVAIVLPPEIKKSIIEWQNVHSEIPVRWVRPENLHITLVPPWYADENEIYETAKSINSCLEKLNQFEINIKKIEYGPRQDAPRLIWAGGEFSEGFTELKRNVESALFQNPQTGFLAPEQKKTAIHVTLARFRPGELLVLPELSSTEVSWKFVFDEFVLLESELKRGGAAYAILNLFAI